MLAVIRADGAPWIGMGHVVRMTALAMELRAAGADVVFAMDAAAPQGAAVAAAAGFTVQKLDGPLDEGLTALRADLFIVDHYGYGPEELERIAAVAPLAVIDDEGTRDLSAAAWILNQNFGAESLAYPLGAQRLLGPSYALLRPEFADLRGEALSRSSSAVESLLVTFGGGTVQPYVDASLEMLNGVKGRFEVVVVGATGSPVASRLPVRFLGRTDEMARVIAAADLVITAGGTTCWELCALGRPMIVLTIAENQRLVAGGLSHAGAALRAERIEEIAPLVDALAADGPRRRALASAAAALVDGLGARRAAASLLSLAAR
jgi:spore coat polysaccharide biosynthesis predicted glycosyltransferase SpsG